MCPLLPSLAIAAVIVFTLCPVAVAQSHASASAGADTTDSADRAPARVATGISGGALRFSDGAKEQGVTAIVAFRPASWLTITGSPALVHATTTTGPATTGLTDLPLSLDATHSFDVAWSPSLDVTMDLALPLGQSSSGLGTGQTSVGGGLGVGVSPVDALSLSVSTGRDFDGQSSGALLAGGTTGWMDGEASVDMSGHATATVGYSADLGASDSTGIHARALEGGLEVPLHGDLALTVDGSHGITRAAPSWSVAVGIGTVFGKFSPGGAINSLRRLGRVFGRSSHGKFRR